MRVKIRVGKKFHYCKLHAIKVMLNKHTTITIRVGNVLLEPIFSKLMHKGRANNTVK